MDIAIIGAGLAGCTAAEKLIENGANVVVFEKSRGLGGRLSTKRRKWAWLDMGAQYFTARSSEFSQQVARWVDEGSVKKWEAQFLRFDSTGLSISPDDNERFVGTPKMNAFLDKHRNSPMTIYFEHKIKQISTDDGAYYIETEKEHFGPYKAIICTAPYDQAISMLGTELTPSIRDNGFVMSPTWAVGLQFAEPLDIHQHEHIGGIFVKKGNLSWVGHNSNKPTRSENDTGDTWILHFNPEWSAQHIEEAGEKIIEEGIASFEKIVDAQLPAITNKIAHRWRYARNKKSDQPETDGYLQVNGEAIYLAGDWTLGGRVENAYLSGYYAAQSIVS